MLQSIISTLLLLNAVVDDTRFRLMGSFEREGRLEMSLNGAWSRVSVQGFNDVIGEAVCSNMNYTG